MLCIIFTVLLYAFIMTRQHAFSRRLDLWLGGDQPKTLGGLTRVFGEKSFAVIFLLLLFIPAMPIPTGVVSDINQAIAVLFAFEMAIGRKTPWLPKKLRKRPIGKITEQRALPFLMRRVRWFEKYSHPHMRGILSTRPARSLIGLIIMFLCIMAFVSIPFTGLDTLPSLGAVIISLGVVLDDIIYILIGLTIGLIGVSLIFATGAAITFIITQIL